MSSERETPKGFLIEAAEHFERQITAEDKEYWANVYNAKNYRRCAAHIDTLESTVSAQAAEIERLREALEPFAQCAEAWREKYLDSEPLIEGFPEMPETPTQLRVGHLVNAATALQGRDPAFKAKQKETK